MPKVDSQPKLKDYVVEIVVGVGGAYTLANVYVGELRVGQLTLISGEESRKFIKSLKTAGVTVRLDSAGG